MLPQEGTGSSKAMSDTMSHVEPAPPAIMPPSAPAPAPPPPPAAPALMPPAAAAPGPFDAAWAVSTADKVRYDEIFASLAPQNGLVRRRARARHSGLGCCCPCCCLVVRVVCGRTPSSPPALPPRQVSGMGVRPILERSGLPVDTLRQAGRLSTRTPSLTPQPEPEPRRRARCGTSRTSTATASLTRTSSP